MDAAAFGPKNFERLFPAIKTEVEERGKSALVVLVHKLLHTGLAKALPELASPKDRASDVANELFVRILAGNLRGFGTSDSQKAATFGASAVAFLFTPRRNRKRQTFRRDALKRAEPEQEDAPVPNPPALPQSRPV